MNDTIYLSTRAAARLAGCQPHVLYANFGRRGHYKGVVPRRGAAGRLSWPADLLRAAVLPPQDQQPDGMLAWLDFVDLAAPETPARDAYNLGLALLGSGATQGWWPAPGQFDESRLKTEAAVLGMAVQAFCDRHSQAETAVAVQAKAWLVRTARAAFRWLGVNRDDEVTA